jgi:DNA-binding NarL/FixJ family response regulator
VCIAFWNNKFVKDFHKSDNKMKALKIILVDDNLTFRNAFKNLLIHEFDADIIGEASGADEFKALQGKYHESDIIFMDVMMPGADGVVLTKYTLWRYPTLKFIAVTMHVDQVYLNTLLEAGFKGCIFKTNLFQEISIAMKTVLDNCLYFPDYITLM